MTARRRAKRTAEARSQAGGGSGGDLGPESWPASKVELWALDRIKPYGRNPKVHPEAQIELIAASMREDGVTAPILVDEAGVIIYGHGRRQAALRNGYDAYPVVQAVGWTEERKRAVRIKDNSYAALAGWDAKLLKGELLDLKMAGYEMPLLGFAEAQLVSFMAVDTGPVPEQIPEPPKKPTTKPGDVWTLGRHRIICGDCRRDADVKKLLAGATVNVAFTSPPYAEQREYDEASGFKPIAPDEYVEWFAPVAALVAKHLAEDGSWFVNIKPAAEGLDTSLYVFDLVIAHIRKWGWHFATEFCWERIGMPKRVLHRFKNQFEPIYQFTRGQWKTRPEAVRHASDGVPSKPGPGFTTSKMQGSDWQKKGPLGMARDEIGVGMAYPGNRLPPFSTDALGHAAAFPTGLPTFFIKAYSDAGDAIYDPFMGSGSTLIAAERNDRRAFGAEISPGYVDVIVERWQNETGEKAKRKR